MVAAALTMGPLHGGAVEEALRVLREGGWPRGDPVVQAIAYANLYGGLLLLHVSREGVVTPLSRVLFSLGLSVEPGGGEPVVLEDSLVLDVWARVYRGEEGALSILEGPLHGPRGYVWRLGGEARVSPSGFSGVVVEEV